MSIVLNICFVALFIVIGCGLLRLKLGPSLLDRVLAFDLIATCVVAMVVLISVKYRTTAYLEAILIVSLLGFFTTVAFVYYFFGDSNQQSKTPCRKDKIE